MTDAVDHYRLLASALPAEEKRIHTLYMPTLVLVLALSTVAFILLGLSHGGTPSGMLRFGLVMAAFIAYMAFLYPRRMRRRLAQCWETYDLEVGSNYLVRRQAELPDLRLPFCEVQSVKRVPGRYVRVIGKPSGRAISIPEGIEQFEKVLEVVSSIHPVKIQRVPQWLKYRVLMMAGLLVYMTMLWSTAPGVVIPLSLVVASLTVWLVVWVRRSPNLPPGSKRMAWVYLLVLFMCGLKLLVAVSPAPGEQRYRAGPRPVKTK